MCSSPAFAPTYIYSNLVTNNTLVATYNPNIYDFVTLASLDDTENYILYPELISELNQCENYGRWDDNRILDSNGKYSYGGLMFQMDTFLLYGKKYKILPQSMTAEWAKTIIYDKDVQTSIANKMIQDGLGRQTWYNCWRIKELDKYL